jgi:hypothetical protein
MLKASISIRVSERLWHGGGELRDGWMTVQDGFDSFYD